jgi:nitrite reductase/ring-hydroxylating ferredoxin subunit
MSTDERAVPQWALCTVGDLTEPATRAFTVGEGPWPLRGFIVKARGEWHAYVNRCPHAGHALNLRPDEFLDREREHLICNSHGARFDVRTGHCVAGPCVGAVLRRIPVVVVEGEALLASGFKPDDFVD